MPFDKSGKFHLNSQRAHAADRIGAKPVAPKDPAGLPSSDPEKQNAGGPAGHTTLHDHGDGTYHTESQDGQRVEHPSIGHALMHIASTHAEGKHLHFHHDGMVPTSHQAGEDGSVEGPHDHENLEALKEHLSRFFDEEEHEGGDGYGESEDDRSLSGLTA